MKGRPCTSRIILAAMLVAPALALSGCKEEKQADQKSQPDQQQAAQPAQPQPAAPAAAPAIRRSLRTQAALDQLNKLRRPGTDEQTDPKLFVPLDAAGHTIPAKPLDKSEMPQLWQGREYALLTPAIATDATIAMDKGGIILADVTGTISPTGNIWKSVNPSSSGGGVHYSHDGVIDLDEPGGGSSSYDADNGNWVVNNGNGTTITVFPNGDSNLYAKSGPDGSFDLHGKDGTTEHVSPDGKDDYTDWGNGKRTYHDDDGTERTVDLNDGSQNISDDKNGTYVDIPPPVSKPPGDKPANGTGEPHYLTRDGTAITTQAAGEFVLVTGVPGHTIQARQEPWRNPPQVSEKASAITAMAFDAGGAKIEVRESGEVLYNGIPADAGDFERADLPQGGAVGVWRKNGTWRTVMIVWPDLSTITIHNVRNYLNFVLQWAKPEPDHRGLLGSNDGVAGNDLTDRNGKVQSSDQDGIAAFVDSWRLRDDESLFTYAPGQSTATFTLRDFPHVKPQLDLASVTGLDGLQQGPFRDFAAYDIALTGDAQFLDGYVEMERLTRAAAGRASGPDTAQAQVKKDQAPAPASGTITLSEDEKRTAQVVAADAQVPVLKVGEATDSVVFKLSLSQAATHTVVSYTPGDKSDGYVAGHPGYAFFTPDGVLIEKPFPAANGDHDVSLPAGTVYFKVIGGGASGVVDVTLH